MIAPDIEHLLPGVKRGDTRAFESLVRAMTEPLFKYAAGIVRDPGAAEEVVQKTFIRVHRRRARLDAAGTLRGYCYRIAHNLSLNHARDERLRRERERGAVEMRDSKSTDPELAALAREAWQLAEGLPQDLRATLHLRFGHGLSLAETAQALEIPEGTVSTRQRTGLQKLRDRLALSAAVPGIDQLDTTLGRAEPATVAAPAGLVARMETLIMASIATKAISNTAILLIASLILAVGGVTIAVLAWPEPQPEQISTDQQPRKNGAPPAANTTAARDTDDSSQSTTVQKPLETHVDSPVDEAAQGVAFVATVRGKVVDSSGVGVSGAGVSVEPLDSFESALAAMKHGAQPTPTGSATSGVGGEFELRLAGTHPEGADRVRFKLKPAAEGLVGSASNAMWVEPGKSLAGVELKLFKPGRIEGIVVLAPDGKTPVPGVSVDGRPSIIGGWGASGINAAPAQAKSGEDGRFVLEAMPPGNWYLTVRGAAGLPRIQTYGDERDVELDEGATVTGVVMTCTGHALTFRTEPAQPSVGLDFSVSTASGSEGAVLTFTGTQYHFAQPDSEGVFRVLDVHSGVKAMIVEAEGFEKHEVKLNIEAAKDLDLGVIKLQPRRSLAGLINDERGDGISGAVINLQSATHKATGTTQYGGVVSSDPLQPGEYTVTVTHAAFAEATAKVVVPNDGAAPALNLTMIGTGGEISGSVTIGGAEPQLWQLGATGGNGITVGVWDAEDTDAWVSQRNAMPGPGGRYILRNLKPGKYLVRADFGDLSVAHEVAVKAAEKIILNFALPVGGALSGLIIGRDGKPAARQRVTLAKEAFDSGFSMFQAPPMTWTDAEGRYKLTYVPAGSYYVRLGSDPSLMSPEQLQPRAVTLKDDETTEFNLDLSQVTGPVILGRVTVNGEVVFKDAVLVTPDQMLSFRTGSIDEHGNFEVSGMKPGAYYLWLADNKWKPRKFVRMPVKLGDNERLEIRRDLRECRLSGRVVASEAATVQIMADAEDTFGSDMAKGLATFKVNCDAQGRFEALLVEGCYKLVASAPGQTAVERVIDLSRDATLDLFVGGAAGKLNVTIAALHGDKTAGPLPEGDMARQVMVRVLDAEGRDIALSDDQRFLYLEKDSAAEVTSLTPGAYRVLLTGAHIEPWSKEIDVRAEEAAEISAELHRAAEVRIKVLNGELTAEQVRQATVEVFDAAGAKVTAGDGITNVLAATAAGATSKTIQVNPLQAGVYRIVIQLTGYADAELNVQLERSRIQDREITLVRQ